MSDALPSAKRLPRVREPGALRVSFSWAVSVSLTKVDHFIYSSIEMRLLAPVCAFLVMAGLPLATQAPRTADGHPDLNGFWKGMKDTKPGGNIAKDLPGHKLPLTPAGEAAWKHNTTATVDPRSEEPTAELPS